MSDGWVSSIYVMGNPAVWWGGLIALLFVIARLFWKSVGDRRYIFVVVGFLSQYMPWMLIQRSTFIYHYFASVPFIILATAIFFEWLRRTRHEIYIRAVWIYGAAALVLFVLFYPLMSGTPFPRALANLTHWFHWFYY
jgi:dolichyl-phosphate-mannose--protein O-mannosyl transferase